MAELTEQKIASTGLPKEGDLVANKYRIEHKIAEGGMGVVVAAHHIELDERVAIKFMRPEVLEQAGDHKQELIDRFLREGRAVIKIRSEHVVRVLDVAKLESGTPYMVMEFLEGRDLDQRVFDDGRLPKEEAVDYVLQSIEALAEAHALGIVHRDLKPANILIVKRRDGTESAKVLDFGISKVTREGEDMKATRADAVMGSPKYMSPEQMRSTRDVDVRADVWAVGIILYELLTGESPFEGTTMTELCARILQDPPRAMKTEIVPEELQGVILRCLEKAPSARFANVAELARALTPFGTDATRGSAQRAARVLRVEPSGRTESSSRSSLPETGSVKSDPSSPEVLFGAKPSTSPSPRVLAQTETTWSQAPQLKKSKTPFFALLALGSITVIGIFAFFHAQKGPSAIQKTNDNAASQTLHQEALPPKGPEHASEIATAASSATSASTDLAATLPASSNTPKTTHSIPKKSAAPATKTTHTEDTSKKPSTSAPDWGSRK